jgi:hypothetical protein
MNDHCARIFSFKMCVCVCVCKMIMRVKASQFATLKVRTYELNHNGVTQILAIKNCILSARYKQWMSQTFKFIG